MAMKDTKLWTWHMAAGMVILVLLGLHMAVMHLGGVLPMGSYNPARDDALSWDNVVFRGTQTMTLVSYVLLLGFGLFHGLYGLRNILLELGLSRGAGRFVGIVLLLLGLGLFAYGAWSAYAARGVALAVVAGAPA